MSYNSKNDLFLQVIMKKSMIWVTIALMIPTMVACSNNDETSDEPLSNEDNELKYISLTRAEQELVGTLGACLSRVGKT